MRLNNLFNRSCYNAFIKIYKELTKNYFEKITTDSIKDHLNDKENIMILYNIKTKYFNISFTDIMLGLIHDYKS
jgi:hypothetical protein